MSSAIVFLRRLPAAQNAQAGVVLVAVPVDDDAFQHADPVAQLRRHYLASTALVAIHDLAGRPGDATRREIRRVAVPGQERAALIALSHRCPPSSPGR